MTNHPNRSRIIEAAGYEVDLTVDPPNVQVVKRRKALGFGYSYTAGNDTYRSTIKVGSANWKRAVKAAREAAGVKAWRVFSNGDVLKGPVDAATIADAMDLLDTRNMSNIQVIENGAWVWAV